MMTCDVPDSMDVAYKVVTHLPLDALWDENGAILSVRRRYLTKNDVARLLRAGPLQFVVADVGRALCWIPVVDRFKFWKTEAKLHFAEPGFDVVFEKVKDHYGYFASEWNGTAGSPTVVLLEMRH